MTLNKLISKAALAYPDGLLLEYWDSEKEQPRRNPGAGDTLAWFIVEEIFETYDADTSDEQQIEAAAHVLENAVSEINNVIGGLKNGGKSEKKEHQSNLR